MVEKRSHNHARIHAGIWVDIERRLIWALAITLGIFVVELIGGMLANSLALKSDAGHLFGDVMALGLSLAAAKLSRHPPTSRRTYGYHRLEVFAAIFNSVTLFVLAGYIFYEAYWRFVNPQPVKSTLMLIVALVGLLANLIVLIRLHGVAHESLNVRAAFWHVLGDMLGSVGVVAGGLIMLVTGNYMADPIISFFVGLIILMGAFGVLREGASILLESVPRTVDYSKLKEDIENIEGVVSIHDLHVWTISSANLALSAHVKITDQSMHSSRKILREANNLLGNEYDIQHATLQLECECCAEADCGCDAPQTRVGAGPST
jgi:cobalt-zinc-cadmium efflux system protein